MAEKRQLDILFENGTPYHDLGAVPEDKILIAKTEKGKYAEVSRSNVTAMEFQLRNYYATAGVEVRICNL